LICGYSRYEGRVEQMQTINHVEPNIHPLMDDIDRLFALLSDAPQRMLVKPVFDRSFKSLVDVFNKFNPWEYTWEVAYTDTPYPPLNAMQNKNIILCFSGGKDSIAAAIKYKELGYNVQLYHLKHINPSFADEWECAQRSADLLGMPIFFDDIGFKGHHMWMEHPMKNMIIANGALSYGIREGITTNIAFGNYLTSELVDNAFDRCAGDCMDMWNSYDVIVQRAIPDFKVMAVLDNMGDTLNLLADRANLLNESLSCLCRHSLRDYRRNWVKEKFGVDLFHNRCGSCYKCCVEYIYMADHDKLPFNEDYYKYCLGQLYRVTVSERFLIMSMFALWSEFIFYPPQKSKIYEKMLKARLMTRSIKWVK